MLKIDTKSGLNTLTITKNDFVNEKKAHSTAHTEWYEAVLANNNHNLNGIAFYEEVEKIEINRDDIYHFPEELQNFKHLMHLSISRAELSYANCQGLPVSLITLECIQINNGKLLPLDFFFGSSKLINLHTIKIDLKFCIPEEWIDLFIRQSIEKASEITKDLCLQEELCLFYPPRDGFQNITPIADLPDLELIILLTTPGFESISCFVSDWEDIIKENLLLSSIKYRISKLTLKQSEIRNCFEIHIELLNHRQTERNVRAIITYSIKSLIPDKCDGTDVILNAEEMDRRYFTYLACNKLETKDTFREYCLHSKESLKRTDPNVKLTFYLDNNSSREKRKIDINNNNNNNPIYDDEESHALMEHLKKYK